MPGGIIPSLSHVVAKRNLFPHKPVRTINYLFIIVHITAGKPVMASTKELYLFP